MTASTSDRDCPTHVRCPATWKPVERTASIAAKDRSRSDPPAPYVTETKAGRASPSRPTVERNASNPSADFGGKTSKEIDSVMAGALPSEPPATASQSTQLRGNPG